MGIAVNALSILIGSLIGSAFKKKIKFDGFVVMSISIMIISLVGFIENIFNIKDMTLKSSALLVLVFSLIAGSVIGDLFNLEAKISSLSGSDKKEFSAIIDSVIFFGVGGMQICGPILLATMGKSDQLILKSIIDFPFAMMFGMSYGKRVSFAVVPVMLGQIAIALITFFSRNIFDEVTIKQLCAMGYIILFFSGFNLVCDNKYKVNTTNMIIGIFIILIYNMVLKFF